LIDNLRANVIEPLSGARSRVASTSDAVIVSCGSFWNCRTTEPFLPERAKAGERGLIRWGRREWYAALVSAHRKAEIGGAASQHRMARPGILSSHRILSSHPGDR
jgi:hypothetical protein